MRSWSLLLGVVLLPAAVSSSSTPVVPSWLSIDAATLQDYKEKAKQRHQHDVLKARESYFSFDDPSATTKEDDIVNKIEFDEYQVHSTQKLPDFDQELDTKIFVTKTPLFTPQECQKVIQDAEDYFQQTANGEWTQLPSGQYKVAGFWIRNVPQVHEWFNQMVQQRLFPLLHKKFPKFVQHVSQLVVDNAYLFKYTPETGRRTDVHTDSGCLSFTIALNGPQDYQGGGTWFENMKEGIIEMSTGQCTIRPGGVRHCGHAVTEGTRYIIGGFCMHTDKVELVRMLTCMGEDERALEAAIALNPQFDGPYTHLADHLHKRGESNQARQVLEHCLQHVNPKGAEVAYSLGLLYLEQQEYAKCKDCMMVCLESDDCDVDALSTLAQACAGLGDSKGEQEYYERIIRTPGASARAMASAYCNLGVLHEGTDKEIYYYEQSLVSKPDENFSAQYSLASAHATREDWTAAASAFRKAIAASDDESNQLRALRALYLVAMEKIRQDHPNVSSREEMLQHFQDVMGRENFERLATNQ